MDNLRLPATAAVNEEGEPGGLGVLERLDLKERIEPEREEGMRGCVER